MLRETNMRTVGAVSSQARMHLQLALYNEGGNGQVIVMHFPRTSALEVLSDPEIGSFSRKPPRTSNDESHPTGIGARMSQRK